MDANQVTGGPGGAGGNAGPSGHYGGNGGAGGSGLGGNLFSAGVAGVTNCTLAAGIASGGTGGAGGTGTNGYPSGGTGAAGSGLGANVANTNGVLNLKDSILAYPLIVASAYGTISDGGYNLSSDATPQFGANSHTNVDPLLAPLANNGGPTLTMALMTNSPAIDAGDPAFSPPPATDQRGFPRVAGARVDVGAFEFGAAAAVTPAVITSVTSIGAGGVQLGISGGSNLTYSVWASSNLVNWVKVGSTTQTNAGQYIYSEPGQMYQRRFYQIRWP